MSVGKWFWVWLAAALVPYWAAGWATAGEPARKEIRFVSPRSLVPYVEAMAQVFIARRPGPPPSLETGVPRAVADAFCAGAGAAHPDLLVLPRRLSYGEYQRCQAQGAGPVLELLLGSEVLVLAVRPDVAPFSLTARQLFLALAAEIPQQGRFTVNRTQSWRQLDPALPDLPIQVLVPAGDPSARELFEAAVLEVGCRGVTEIQDIFSAQERLARCRGLRADGAAKETPVDGMAPALRANPPGLIAILPLTYWTVLAADLTILPLDGRLPTQANLDAGVYPLSRPIYLYGKLAQAGDGKTYGVADSLRQFLRDVGGEQGVEPGGLFEQMGLVLPAPPVRVRQRLDALMSRPLVR